MEHNGEYLGIMEHNCGIIGKVLEYYSKHKGYLKSLILSTRPNIQTLRYNLEFIDTDHSNNIVSTTDFSQSKC